MIDIFVAHLQEFSSAYVAGGMVAFVGGKLKWVFSQTGKNEKDIDAAFAKIRLLEREFYDEDNHYD